MLQRRAFLAGCGASLFAQTARPQRPNIVFLLLDDLGYHDIGCYGQQKIETPHIDRLAAEGMRFTNAYAGGPVCAPSRCVLMTGRHGGHARIRANAGTAPIGPEDITFPKWLQQQGYVCGGFGKWGLGDAGSTGVPSKHGFNEFYGYLHQVHAHTYWPDFLWDNEQKAPLGGKTYSADAIAERSYAFLRKHRDKPFFLYATFTVPHGRYETPDVKPYEDRDWPEGEKKYAAMVTQGDRYIGRLLTMLREFGLERNTLVFFASDNGGVAGEGHKLEFFNTMGPFRGQKGTLYEGGLRVPFLMRWPGRIREGTTNDAPASFADVFATIRHAVTGRAAAYEDGESLLSLDAKKQRRKPLVWENHRWNQKTKELAADFGMAVRVGGWKAVRPKPDAPLELYNLLDDPGERRDLAASEPEVAARLAKVMHEEHTPPLRHDGDMQFVK